MIKTIHIENFKSIHQLELELGRFNVLIGENGCGKTNILEAIGMAGAASADKLDNEFLASRGIRVTKPTLMRSGFEEKNDRNLIKISYSRNKFFEKIKLDNDNTSYSKWYVKNDESEIKKLKLLDDVVKKRGIDSKEFHELYQDLFSSNYDFQKYKKVKKEDQAKIVRSTLRLITDSIKKYSESASLNSFLIFCPENTFLRDFERPSQIEPLGIRGEGLFKLLTVFNDIENQKDNEQQPLTELIECLQVFDWFDDFEIKQSFFGERSLTIKDRYLEDGIAYITQRSSNEGFLFLLFYFSLFISEYTPKFFAIDNIENALNPKLCRKLMVMLYNLAVRYDKQVIFTTHNPAILDGLNLNDDEQRLFVVRRNKLGHTKINRINKKTTLNGQPTMKLSEAFINGYLGGLPKSF